MPRPGWGRSDGVLGVFLAVSTSPRPSSGKSRFQNPRDHQERRAEPHKHSAQPPAATDVLRFPCSPAEHVGEVVRHLQQRVPMIGKPPSAVFQNVSLGQVICVSSHLSSPSLAGVVCVVWHMFKYRIGGGGQTSIATSDRWYHDSGKFERTPLPQLTSVGWEEHYRRL